MKEDKLKEVDKLRDKGKLTRSEADALRRDITRKEERELTTHEDIVEALYTEEY